jgi:hypothetical protein
VGLRKIVAGHTFHDVLDEIGTVPAAIVKNMRESESAKRTINKSKRYMPFGSRENLL